jgi:ubiquinone/menaquinone biosynthesis C-methylase UbiE
MGLYSRFLLPRIIHLACSTGPTMRQRAKIVPSARGRVLEVGIGSGLNLSFYDSESLEHLCGLDPSREMIAMATEAARGTTLDVELVCAGSEDIPYDADSFDTVVVTYALCSIPDAVGALAEMARVLKPNGRLLFCEHGVAPDPAVSRWQRRVDPVWRRLGGGCHLDRDIPALLRSGGFDVQELDTMYIPGWRPASFNYWGAATPA